MSVFPRLRSLALLAVVALCLVGCKQGEGEVCDVDGDCESGLLCCGGGSEGLPDERGLCQPEEDVCPDRPEPEVDAGPTPDAGPARDAGPTDAGSVQDAGTDAGTVADGGTDAGAIDDAGADAGDGG